VSKVANEAINQNQLFLQFAGKPNRNGTIEFFTDSGRTILKNIFSDEALTVAQSNPYTLDDTGRISEAGEGEVHYTGTATLVHEDNNGFEFRQDDEVVVSPDGEASSITINEQSVASMVVNLTLEVGAIVKTEGYYFPNPHGSARYVIVPGDTGTADGFRFINLGNGFQAQLLDLEENHNFLVAGARGDGASDDTKPMQAVIKFGGDIKVEGSFSFVGTNLLISKNVRFVGAGEMKQRDGSAGDFLQITSVDVTLVKFRDVILNGNQPNVDPLNATVGWAIE